MFKYVAKGITMTLVVDHLLNRFFQYYQKREGMNFNKRGYANAWSELIGDMELIPLTQRETADELHLKAEELRSNIVTGATFNRYVSYLSVAFATGMKGMLGNELRCSIYYNVARDIQREPEGFRYKEPLTTEEVKRLLRACKESSNSDLYYIVKLIALTGRRRGEILSIESSMIKQNSRMIIIPLEKTKTKKRDTVIPILDEELWEYLLTKKKFSNGRIFPFKNPRKALVTALRRAGIDEGKQFHALRHTVCTTLYEEGQVDAGLYVGHSNPMTTGKHYLHARRGMFEKNQKKLMDVFEM